jgi:hypothetical protein
MTIIAGQPLDLDTIIAALAKIDDLESALGAGKNESVIIKNGIATFYPTSSMSIEAANVSLEKTEAKADQIGFSHTFKTKYRQPPVVTATLVHTAKSTVVRNHSVVITNIDTSGVSGYVSFQASGNIPETTVNLVAIGTTIG